MASILRISSRGDVDRTLEYCLVAQIVVGIVDHNNHRSAGVAERQSVECGQYGVAHEHAVAHQDAIAHEHAVAHQDTIAHQHAVAHEHTIPHQYAERDEDRTFAK